MKRNQEKENHVINDQACALFDGGWRAADKDQLMDEYMLTVDEADSICWYLEQYEENDSNK